jgi:hypothetical protein
MPSTGGADARRDLRRRQHLIEVKRFGRPGQILIADEARRWRGIFPSSGFESTPEDGSDSPWKGP